MTKAYDDLRLYDDVRTHLDRAIESANGIRITCTTKGQAVHLRQRLYKLRQLTKSESVEIFPVGDPRRATTPWDNISIELDDNVLRILHKDPVKVEEI